ncbi:PREDICTED: uncharacterized protein LOC108550556 [Eufriesea mexicana]|uniref:uncharacterized protein LOC108550556 n=1 Tax=Eufriesea mexicana TaxID=516756 RepID=UPI00083C43FD|nr:PREDICTED: uncharacterized protein LOC108550556 [Eufriesea mexicana]
MNDFVEGTTFEGIVRYVLKKTKMTEARAGYLVMEVLKAGVALGRIKRTSHGTYVLATERPGSITHRIREPRFSDDSDDNDREVSSEGSW